MIPFSESIVAGEGLLLAQMVRKSALIVIDMQQFFFAENQGVDQHKLVAHCREIIGISRNVGIPVIHVVTIYREDRIDWPEAWREQEQSWCANLVRDRELSDEVAGLGLKPHDLVVEKKRFSAFYNTNLDDILRGLGCKYIYVIGYSGDVCVRFTSVDAYNRGYGIGLVEAGIESFKETKEKSLDYLEWLIGADRISIDELKKITKG